MSKILEKILSYKESKRAAVIDCGRVVTYQKLVNDALLISKSLPNQGLPIGLKFQKNYEYILNMLAVCFSQDFFIPLYLDNPKERTEFIIKDLNIRNFLTKESKIEDNDESSEFTLFLDKETEYAIYTSGTTGVPKGVKITRKGLENTIEQQVKMFGYNRSNCFLFLSINFDASLSDIFCALSSESTIYIDDAATKSPKSLFSFINDNKISHLDIPPSFLKLMTPQVTSLKTIIIGGESPSVESATDWAKYCNIFNVYGPTECSICTSIEKVNSTQKEISIGTPLNNINYFVQGDELLIEGIGVAKEYICREDLSYKFKLIDGKLFFKTGDLVVEKDGKYFFKGRKDSQIKVNGQMVNLQELEQVCLKNNFCKNSMAFYLDEKIFLIYEGDCSETELRTHLDKYIPKYMFPNFIFNYCIEKNVNGKNDYRIMKNYVSNSFLNLDKINYLEYETENAVLLNGSNGLLGSKVLEDLYSRNKNIYCFVRTINKNKIKGINYIVGDLSKVNFGLDIITYNELLRKVNTVINCAGEVNNLKSYKELYNNNVQSVKNIIEFCKFGNKKLKHVSSLSTEVSMLKRKKEIDENCLERKNNFIYSGYAQTKFESELMVNHYNNSEIIRPGLVISEDFCNYPRFLIKICQLIKKNKEIPKLDIDLMIDFTPIELVSKSILSKESFKVINASINLKISLREIADLFNAKELEKEVFFEKYKGTLFSKMFSEVYCNKNMDYSIFETTGVNSYKNKNFLTSIGLNVDVQSYKNAYLKIIKDNI